MNIYKIPRIIKKNSPTLLTVLGGVGVVVSTVTASVATTKASKLMQQATEEKGEELTTKEKVLIAGKEYIPTALICATTISCIFGANILNKKSQASLASAYALVNESYQNYRKSLIELYGEEADIEVRDNMVLARTHEAFHELNLNTPDQMCMFVEEYTGQWKYAYEREIMDAEYHINRNYVLRGYMTLDEYLEIFGFDPVEGSDIIGWSTSDSEMYWIDFYHRTVEQDGKEIQVISTTLSPTKEALEDWYV